MSLFFHWNRFGGIQHWSSCSAMDPLQWMGAVRMRVQTADKNITIIHTTPVHHCFWLKFESSVHNIAYSSEKVISSESGEKYAQIKHCFQAKNCFKQIYWWILMRESNRGRTFSLEEALLWITCGLLGCFYYLFGLSFWRHPFTAEDPLVSKWCNATFLQICSHEETNSSTSWMSWVWVNFQWICICGWTIHFLFLSNYSFILKDLVCACFSLVMLVGVVILLKPFQPQESLLHLQNMLLCLIKSVCCSLSLSLPHRFLVSWPFVSWVRCGLWVLVSQAWQEQQYSDRFFCIWWLKLLCFFPNVTGTVHP